MKSSILATLSYADIFDYPLTKEEIWQWLVGNLKFKIVSRSEIPLRGENLKLDEVLKQLIEKKLCGFKNGYYFLPGREGIVKTREQREGLAKEKIKRAEKVAGILRFIPWIKLIGITGALARKNSSCDDDIDLFFITAQNRLWLSRGLMVLTLRVLGLYRRPNKITNMICPNMLISEDALKMEPEDLFTAHEVCLMKPIFARDQTYQKFLGANSWVEKFLPHVYRRLTRIGNADKRRISVNQRLSQRQSALERVARDLQLWYMRKRRTAEVVSDDLIKFHPQDAREWVLQEFQRKQKLYRFDRM